MSSCSSTAPNTKGKSIFGDTAAVLYPNAQGILGDLHFTFSVDRDLPLGSSIEITGNAVTVAGSITKDTTFSNIKFSSVSVSGSAITIITSEAISSDSSIEFYFDKAVTAGTAATTGSFQITTSYNPGGVITEITNDSAVTPTANKYEITYGALPTAIPAGTIAATVKTPGEMSSYTFTYTTPVAIAATDTLWVLFDHGYDPNIGDSMEYSSGDWRIECSSTVFTSAICKVDHWMVIVSNLAAADASSAVDITIDFVKTPASATYTFGMVHLTGTAATSATDSFGTFIVENNPGYLDLRSASTSNTQQGANGDYTFKLYVDTDIAASDALMIKFPNTFTVEQANGNKNSCTAKFYDESVDSETTNEIDASVTSCTIDENSVTWTASSSLATAVNLDTHDRVEIVVSGLENQRWGYERTVTANKRPW